jgi:hypothetical protein
MLVGTAFLTVMSFKVISAGAIPCQVVGNAGGNRTA